MEMWLETCRATKGGCMRWFYKGSLGHTLRDRSGTLKRVP
jgi:hypothetical protein